MIEGSELLLLERDGATVAALAHGPVAHDYVPAATDREDYVLLLVADPSVRGVGRRLLDESWSRARADGIERQRVDCYAGDDGKLVRFYESAGLHAHRDVRRQRLARPAARAARLTPAAVRTVLARAFVDDPLMAWFFPDAETRPHACAALFGLFAETYLRSGRVDVAGGEAPVAVAMWRWPGRTEAPDGTAAQRAGADDRADGRRPRGADRGAMSVIAGVRPPEPSPTCTCSVSTPRPGPADWAARSSSAG